MTIDPVATSQAKPLWMGVGVANTVSIVRMLLAFLAVWLLFQPCVACYWWSFGLTVLVFWLDGVDGFLARKLNESSAFGALVDIASDRVVELVYWVSYCVLGWVPLWMPLVVITRGVWVDGIRSLALQEGFTAFGTSTMMQHPLGVLLVSSRFSRWTYAVLKAVGFSLFILARMPFEGLESLGLETVCQACIYGSLFFCVVRGLPVLLEGRRFIR
jgi:CDP-diacylglycerol---glycerol-3-phosphate 3-phosphatidyltransferase